MPDGKKGCEPKNSVLKDRNQHLTGKVKGPPEWWHFKPRPEEERSQELGEVSVGRRDSS